MSTSIVGEWSAEEIERRERLLRMSQAYTALGLVAFFLANNAKTKTIETTLRIASSGGLWAGGYAIYKANERDGHLTSFGWAKVGMCGALGVGNLFWHPIIGWIARHR